jgi:hypothetical protein
MTARAQQGPKRNIFMRIFLNNIIMKKVILILLLNAVFGVRLLGQVGRVGINTITPAAMLDVKDSSVVFSAAISLPVNPGLPPVSGSGVRFMWYADKAALRAGSAFGTSWDKDSIGSFSIAAGFGAKAIGGNSMAFGNLSVARGNTSTATGRQTIASGNNSTATGSQTIASGINSFAANDQSEASGQGAFAAGTLTTASGLNSVTMGLGTDATGSYSTALGFGGRASGNRSFKATNESYAAAFTSMAIGRFNDTITGCSPTTWVDTDPLFCIGNGVDFFNRSNAMTVLKNGRTGLNTANPKAMLHVIKGQATNGPINSNAAAILEGDQGSFLQLSNNNNIQGGILSGNEETSIRGAIIFTSDSGMNLRTGGNTTRVSISKDGNTNFSGEVRRTPTGSANIVPVCYGAVDATGAILTGTGNFSVTPVSAGLYEITIANETYSNAGYISNVTPVSSNPRFVSTNHNNGNLVLRFFNSAGTLTDTTFQFVMYKP